MQLMEELASFGVQFIQDQPIIKVNMDEDNVGAIKLAKLLKLQLRTKHIGIQCHHFGSWTTRGPNDEEPHVKVQHISTEFQQANIFTKPLARPLFQSLQYMLCGW